MNNLKKKYLSSLLFIIVLLTLTFAYIFLVFINYDANKTMMEELAKSSQLNIVKGYKRQIDEWLSAKKRIISSSAEFLSPLSPEKNYAEIRHILQGAIAAGAFRSVYIGYLDNSFVTGINWTPSENYYPTERPWFIVGKERAELSITLPYIDSDLREEVISIVSPVYKEGVVIGVLSSDLILDSIQKEILSINLPFNGFAFLVSKKGKVLVSPYGFSEQKCDGCEPAIDVILESQESDGTITYEYNGKKYLLSYESLENSDWIFATVLDEEKIFGNINEKLFKNVIMAIGFSGLGFSAILLFLFISRKLFQHKRLLDSFAHSSIHAMAIINKKKRVVFANKPLQKFLGLKNPIEFGEQLENLYFLEGDLSLLKKIVIEVNDVIDNHLISKTLKLPNDNTLECILIQVMAIVENGQRMEGCILKISDITHEYGLEIRDKEHEQMILQHSKMAAMGEMVGAITHQWRQPLAALLVMMGMLRIQVEEKNISEERLLESFDKSVEIIKFMEETLQSFKSFYKTGQEKEFFDISAVIEEVVCIMKPMSRIHNIDLSFIYDYQKDYIMFSYPNYLKQILVNLISNAKDAILEKNDSSFEPHIKIEMTETKGVCTIFVEDDGCGIQKGFEEKLFKAMQTTKGLRGTGHGLYLCKLLVENKLGGHIEIESFVNPTRFKLTFLIGDKNG